MSAPGIFINVYREVCFVICIRYLVKNLKCFKKRNDRSQLYTWVKDLVALRIENDDTLVLQTEGDLFRNTLERFYTKLVEECVQRAINQKLNVRFVTREVPMDDIEDDLPPSSIVSPPTIRNDCPSLKPEYTFDTFITGESNRFSYAAALAVAENPFIAYNPLYIYGGVGLGKTHLMHAIGHYIHGTHPEYKILYVTSENFTNDVVQSIANNDRTGLREKYRNLDVLLVDDIQFIAGKEATEMEFFNIFNDLKNADKQIIITSDTAPKDIKKLEERLITRFGWGLITDIQPPDFETRLAILRSKAQRENVEISDEVLGLIAEKVFSNIRDLEGCLNKMLAYAKFIERPVTPAIAEGFLKDYVPGTKKRVVDLELIKQITCDYYNVTPEDMNSKRRDHNIAMPRQMAMYLSRKLTDSSYNDIGAFYGDKHYTTVMYACEQIEKEAETDSALKKNLDDLTEKIRNG